MSAPLRGGASNPFVYFDEEIKKKLPRKIVLPNSIYDKISENQKNIIRQYNNEVKIFSHYYRKVYNTRYPLIPTFPIDSEPLRLDINAGNMSLLKQYNDSVQALNKYIIETKNKDKIINYLTTADNGPDQIVVKDSIIDLLKYINKQSLLKDGSKAKITSNPFIKNFSKYTSAVINYYINKETKLNSTLSLPTLPIIDSVIMDEILKEITKRRVVRKINSANTLNPYALKTKYAKLGIDYKDIDIKKKYENDDEIEEEEDADAEDANEEYGKAPKDRVNKKTGVREIAVQSQWPTPADATGVPNMYGKRRGGARKTATKRKSAIGKRRTATKRKSAIVKRRTACKTAARKTAAKRSTRRATRTRK